MGKIDAGFSVGFIHILIFSLYLSAKFQSKNFQSDGAFFPLNGRETLAKKVFFCGWKDLEKVLAKSGGCGVFFKNGTKESILHNLKL